MKAYSILKNIFDNLLNTNLVNKIYHDVRIIDKKNERLPAYRNGSDWNWIAPDDSRIMLCYLRQTGSMDQYQVIRVGGCDRKKFNVRIPYRLVFFNAYEERNFDSLEAALTNCIFVDHVDLVRVINDSGTLLKQESNQANTVTDGNAFYMAIDFLVYSELTKSNCQALIDCSSIDNPICKLINSEI